jgi:hypothetical protein
MIFDSQFAARPRTVDAARDVAAYLHAELSAAGLTKMILTMVPGLAVLSIADDFAVWTNGTRLWWRDGGRVRFHAVAERRDARRLVFGRYHGRGRQPGTGAAADAATGVAETETGTEAAAEIEGAAAVRDAGDRLRTSLAERGVTCRDMDVFAERRVAVVYAYGERRRATVTVAGGTYSWPTPTARLRSRPWSELAHATTEIAGQLQGWGR